MPGRPYQGLQPEKSGGNSFIYGAFLILMVANLALPKGGVNVGGIPLTFGYAFVALLTLPAAVGALARGGMSVVPVMQMLLGFMPLTLFVAYKLATADAGLTSVLVELTLFFGLPLIMLIIFSSYLEDLTESQIGGAIKWCIRFSVAWGLINFVAYALTKKIIEVPYLTINSADIGEIYSKNNARGHLMKLVSSYNNGNLFGTCMIMFAPLYVFIEKNRSWVAAFFLAIVLTLSRTAWIGLVCTFLVMVLLGQVKINKGYVWFAMIGGLGAIGGMMAAIGWSSDKLVDANLGGRAYQIEQLSFSFFGADAVQIHEIIYAGLFQSFGFIGFMFVLVALFFPVGYGFLFLSRLSAFRKSAMAGCLLYLITAASDGGFAFPPVLLHFLFLTALVYRRGFRGARVPRAADGVMLEPRIRLEKYGGGAVSV